VTNTTVLIPDDLLPAVQQYVSKKEEFQEAMEVAQEMKELATEAPTESSYDPISQLTTDGEPPAELFAAQHQLVQALTEIKEAQETIERKESEIENIQSSARMYTIAIIVATIVAVIIVAAMLMSG